MIHESVTPFARYVDIFYHVITWYGNYSTMNSYQFEFSIPYEKALISEIIKSIHATGLEWQTDFDVASVYDDDLSRVICLRFNDEKWSFYFSLLYSSSS